MNAKFSQNYNELPLFDIYVTEDGEEDGLDFVSLVDDPAIGVNWIALRKKPKTGDKVDISESMVFLRDEKQHILTGPLAIPDLKIYRKDETTEQEYFVRFTSETIKQMRNKFFSSNSNDAINFMHEDQLVGNYLVESWIIEDSEKDKAAALGFDLPKGTLMVSVKINDADFWNEYIESGKLRGFSLEGMFGMREIEMALKKSSKFNYFNKIENEMSELNKTIKSLLSNLKGKGKKKKLVQLSTIKKWKAKLTAQALVIMNPMLDDGTEIIPNAPYSVVVFWAEADKKPKYVDYSGVMQELPDGNYLTEGGDIVMVEGGELMVEEGSVPTEEVAAAEDDEKKETEMQAMETELLDGTMVSVSEANEVQFVFSDGTITIPSDGEYETVDGSILVIADGILIETKPVELNEDIAMSKVKKAATSATPEANSILRLEKRVNAHFKNLSSKLKLQEEMLSPASEAVVTVIEEVNTIDSRVSALELGQAEISEKLTVVMEALKITPGAQAFNAKSRNVEIGQKLTIEQELAKNLREKKQELVLKQKNRFKNV